MPVPYSKEHTPSSASLGSMVPVRVAPTPLTSLGGPVVTVGGGTRAVTACPLVSTATQKPPGKQEMPAIGCVSALDVFHAGIGRAGSSLARACPRPSTVTHRPEEAHETPVRRSLSIGVKLHVAAEAPGSALVSASPAPSTASHVPAVEQETP